MLSVTVFSQVPQVHVNLLFEVSYSATESAEQSGTLLAVLSASAQANGTRALTATRIEGIVSGPSLPNSTKRKPRIHTKHPTVDMNKFHMGDPSLRARLTKLLIFVQSLFQPSWDSRTFLHVQREFEQAKFWGTARSGGSMEGGCDD